jgi:hypothetical protein
MNHIKLTLLGIALAVALPVSAQSVMLGNTVPAIAGTPMAGSDWSCFDYVGSTLKNTCASSKWWFIPLKMTSIDSSKEISVVG